MPGGRTMGARPAFVKVDTKSRLVPYYYTKNDDPGYGYVPDYEKPDDRSAWRRYKLEDIVWMIGASTVPESSVTRETKTTPEARQQSASALDGRIQVIYGRDEVAGPIFELLPGSFLVNGIRRNGVIAAYGLGHGENDAIEQVRFYENKVQRCSGDPNLDTGFTGDLGHLASWHFRNGAVDQAVDPDLVAAHLRQNRAYPFTHPGLSYGVLRMVYEGPNANTGAEGRTAVWPSDPLWTIRGRRLLDPRNGISGGLPLGVAAWTQNPALALADYIANPYYGQGLGLLAIDWPSVVDAAGYCDEIVASDKVVRIDVTDGGRCISTTVPTLTISAPGGGGTQATGYVSDYGWSEKKRAYEVRAITISNPGSGYSSAPTITWSVSFLSYPTYVSTLGEKRHTLNITLFRPASHKANIDTLRAHFRAGIIKRGGKHVITLDRAKPRAKTFDGTNSRPVSLVRESFVSVPNRVEVTWINPRRGYKEERAYAETANVTAGIEPPSVMEFSLEGCRSPGEAMRAAYYFLNKQLLNLRVSIIGTLASDAAIEPYDRIGYSSVGLSIDDQDFTVTTIGIGADNQYPMELELYDEAIFADLLETVDGSVASTLDDPAQAPTAPSFAEHDHWGPSYKRSNDRFLTGWTASGVTSFTAANVNNGDETVTAGVMPVTVGSYFQLDAGAAYLFNDVYVTTAAALPADVVLYTAHSDNGSAFSSYASESRPVLVRSDGTSFTYRIYVAHDGGAHRYWRLYAVSLAAAITVREVWFRYLLDEEWPIARYRIYHKDGVSILAEIDARPAVAGSYTAPSAARTETEEWDEFHIDGTFTRETEFIIAPVRTSGVEGERARVYHLDEWEENVAPGPTTYVPQRVSPMVLVNGVNATPAGDYYAGVFLASGHTGAASIPGLGKGADGVRRMIFNAGTGNLTLEDADTSAAAADRFSFGADIVISPGKARELWYDGTLQRWREGPEGQPGATGAAGVNGVGFTLSNESHTVPSNTDGSSPVLTGASGTVKVASGSTDVTAAATIGAATATGCTGTVNTATNTPVAGQPKGYYVVTAMSADTATLDIPITYGSVSVTLRFSLSKSKQGITGTTGASAKTLVVISDKQQITYSAAGALSPGTQTTTFTANKQNTSAVVSWTMERLDGTSISAATYLSAVTGDSVTMTAANFDTARGATEGVVVIGTLTDGTTITDRISIVRVKEGATGAVGAQGPAIVTFATKGTGAAVITSNSIGKTSGSSAWDAGVNSQERYPRGVFLSFTGRLASDSHGAMGLNTDPGAGTHFNIIDYAIETRSPTFPGGGNAYIQENGTQIASIGAFTDSTVFGITYDGVNVRYYKDGVLQRTVARALGSPLYLDAAIYFVSATATFRNIAFGPMGEQGATGATGATGTPATTLLAQANALAALGGRVLVGATTKLAAALSSVATSISVDSDVFVNGDRVVLQKVVSGVQQTEYLAITSGPSGTGPYSYSVTRNLDASGADTWAADDPVTSLGQTGGTFIDIYSARGLKSSSEVGPSIVGNVRNSSTWDDWSSRFVLGNLNGLFGYSTNLFGLACGIPTGAWLKIDPTNGIRIGHNATVKIQLDAAGNASFSGSLSAATGSFAGSLSGATGSFSGSITASSGAIGGWTIGASLLTGGSVRLQSSGVGAITVGSPFTYNTSGTKFYADGNGLFSLGTKVLWDGTNVTIHAGNVTLDSFGISMPWGGIDAAFGYTFTNSGATVGGLYAENGNSISIATSAVYLTVGTTAARVGGGSLFCDDGISTGSGAPGAGYVAAANGFKVGSTQVIGARGAAIASPTADVASLKTAVDAIRSRLAAHGLIS